MICLKCKTPNPEGAKYCVKCGASLTPEGHKYKCSKCGGVFQGHVTFCPNCGARMRWPGEEDPTPVALTPDIKIPSNAVEGSQEFLEVEAPKQPVQDENPVSSEEQVMAETVAPVVSEEVVQEETILEETEEENGPVLVSKKIFNFIQIGLICLCVLFALISAFAPAFQVAGTTKSLKMFTTYYNNGSIAFSFFDANFNTLNAGKISSTAFPENLGWLFGYGWKNLANLRGEYLNGYYANGSSMTISAILPLIIQLITFIIGLAFIIIGGLLAIISSLKSLKGNQSKASNKFLAFVAGGALTIQGGVRLSYSQLASYDVYNDKVYDFKFKPGIGFFLAIIALVCAAGAVFIKAFAIAKENGNKKKSIGSIFVGASILTLTLACLLISGRIFKFIVKYSSLGFTETAEFGLMSMFLNICFSYVKENSGINFGLAIFVVLILILSIAVLIITILNIVSLGNASEKNSSKPIKNIILAGIQFFAIILIFAFVNSLELKVAGDDLMFGDGKVSFVQQGSCLVGALICSLLGVGSTVCSMVFSKKSK